MNYIDNNNWDNLFDILTKSSPTSLFKLTNLGSLKLFLENWKGRHPLLLQTVRFPSFPSFWSSIDLGWDKYFDLIKKYEDVGIVKKYNDTWNKSNLEGFEWIQEII